MRMRMALVLGAAVMVTATGATAAAQGAKAGDKTKRPNDVALTLRADEASPDGTTPLHEAVLAGDATKVRALIKAGANVKAANKYSVTPLALAAQSGDAAITELLLQAGADPNTVSGEGETVLMTASRTGNPKVVEALLAHGANVNKAEEWYKQTALMWAAAENHADVVKLLAKAGADLNAKADPVGKSGPGIATNPPGGLSPLLYASRQGAMEAARALLDAGADPNITDPNGSPALVYALMNGHFDLADMLLNRGANPNVYDKTGRGPLFVAVDMHSLENLWNRPSPQLNDKLTSLDMTKRLLEAGADVNHELTANLIPPKAFAAGNRNLTAGATPFLKAATTSDVEMMKLLVEWGANPFATNKTHANAAIMAAGLGWRAIFSFGPQEQAIEAIKLCLAYGMDINATDDLGNTALHGAASRIEEQDANKLIQWLVDNGANLYAKNKGGRTPLDEAQGEARTKENANGGGTRGTNHRSTALLLELMKTHPDASKQSASAAQ